MYSVIAINHLISYLDMFWYLCTKFTELSYLILLQAAFITFSFIILCIGE